MNSLTPSTDLTPEERLRYSRQTALPEIGEAGQMRLRKACVLIVGAGGLGSPAAMYLAAAGVGHIVIADGDIVDLTNLQRQIAHTTASVDTPKAKSARDRMTALNPDITVTTIQSFVTPALLRELIERYRFDFVIDATDSFDAKFYINDICHSTGTPCSYGAIFRYDGQLMTCLPGTATLRDLFPSPPAPDTHNEAPKGPLGVVPGIIGTLQATEAIKYITGIGTLLTDTLLYADLLTMTFTRINILRHE